MMPSPVRGVFDDSHNPEVPITEALARVPLDLTADLYAAKSWVRSTLAKKEIGKVPDMTPDTAMAIWLYVLASSPTTICKQRRDCEQCSLLSSLANLMRVEHMLPLRATRVVHHEHRTRTLCTEHSHMHAMSTLTFAFTNTRPCSTLFYRVQQCFTHLCIYKI